MLRIFHNPRCRKSREGLAFLKSCTTEFTIVDYISEGLTKSDLEEILLKTHLEPQQLLRTQEEVYRKELKGKDFTREEWIQIICENPKLLQRPMVIAKHKAVLGIPPEKILKVIENK